MSVDLHIHTTYSDGTLLPSEVVDLAKTQALQVIAITDHDTTEGIGEALKAAAKQDLTCIPGIELSIESILPGDGHLHMLGLFIDYNDAHMNKVLGRLRMAREKRNQEILSRLRETGIDLDINELFNISGKGSVGRPHIARLLVNNGYVSNIGEAFEKYLKNGAPAYIAKKKLDEETGINLIKDSGGLSILAHPVSLGFTSAEDMEQKILELREKGLDGLEVYSSFHSAQVTGELLEIAEKHNLLVSGGSDFHGANKPEIKIGRGIDNVNISESIYLRLQAASDSRN